MALHPAFRRRGWWYPYIFVAGFAVVLAVNLAMMFSAVHTFSGLETDHAYEKGLAYNDVLAMARTQQAMGWTVNSEIRPVPAGSGHAADLLITFLDRQGMPLTGLTVKAEFIRPTSAGHDSSLQLLEQGEGRYEAMVDLVLGGQWEMHLTARHGDLVYQYDKRIYVP
jgi:nitrogen fixation protein FixH